MEFPRLCRGGSNSLTIPAVVPHASTEETLNVSRQAHDGSSIDEWVLSLPRLRAQTPSESFSGSKRGSCTWGSGTIMQSTPELAIPSECAIVPRVRMRQLRFPGQIAYVWHAGLHSTVVQQSLESQGFTARAQIIWVKQHFVLSRGDYHWQHEPCWYAVRNKRNWTGDRKQTTIWET
jgi:hypothetical protein